FTRFTSTLIGFCAGVVGTSREVVSRTTGSTRIRRTSTQPITDWNEPHASQVPLICDLGGERLSWLSSGLLPCWRQCASRPTETGQSPCHAAIAVPRRS